MDPINRDPPPVRPNPGMPIRVFLAVDAVFALLAVLSACMLSPDVLCLGVAALPFLFLAQLTFVSCAGVWDPALPVGRDRFVGAMGVYSLVVAIHLAGMAETTDWLLARLLGVSYLGAPIALALVVGVPWLTWILVVGGLTPSWPRVKFYAVATLSLLGAAFIAAILIGLTCALGGPLQTWSFSMSFLTAGFALGVAVVWLNMQYALTPEERVYLRRRAALADGSE